MGYRSVSQERRRLRDGLSNDRNAQNSLNGLLENVTVEELSSWGFLLFQEPTPPPLEPIICLYSISSLREFEPQYL